MADSLLAEIYLGKKTCDNLRQFFRRTWECEGAHAPFLFRAYITRRAFNLNEFFMEEALSQNQENAQALLELRDRTFLTQNGLLCYAETLVCSYLETNRFPEFLIVDELIINGRGIGDFLSMFESLLQEAWLRLTGNEEMDSWDYWAMHDHLLEAVHILIFTSSKEAYLLESELCERIDIAYEFQNSEWHNFAWNTSCVLNHCDSTSNTSFIPTYLLNQEQFEQICGGKNGKPEEWSYRNITASIWNLPNYAADCANIDGIRYHFTVRAYLTNDKKYYKVTPLALFGDLRPDQIQSLCMAAAEVLEKDPETKAWGSLLRVLKLNYELQRSVTLQLIIYLFSTTLFFQFLEESGIDALEAPQGSALRISRNFGVGQDIKDAFCGISEYAAHPALCARLCRRISDALVCFIGPAQRLDAPGQLIRYPDRREEPKDTCLQNAENLFYEIALRDERDVFRMRTERRVYDSFTKAMMKYGLQNYLAASINEKGSGAPCSFEGKISALLLMMDSGIVRLNTGAEDKANSVRAKYHSDEKGISMWIKCGEQSKAIGVRRLYRFIPALIEIERACRKRGYLPAPVIADFGSLLQERGLENGMREQFEALVGELYESGSALADWEFDLISGLDQPNREKRVRTVKDWSGEDWGDEWEEMESSSRLHYLFWEKDNQEKYRKLSLEYMKTI